MIDSSNKASYITYNADNQVINTVDEAGNTTAYAYADAYGDLQTVNYNIGTSVFCNREMPSFANKSAQVRVGIFAGRLKQETGNKQ